VNCFSGPAEQTDEDRNDKLSMSFPRTFGPRDPYSRPSTPAPDYHRATALPNKIDIILRKALADTARDQEQLALEVGKRTYAQASMQAISGLLQDGMTSLLQDGMTNTMSALKHWEPDKNSGVQFGKCTPLPLSAQSISIFIQDESRYVYQQQQQSGATQFSDVFQTPAPDGDPWSLAMSVPRMDSYNARLSTVPQMQSPAPLIQSGRLVLAMQEAAERQQFRSWMLLQLHNTPVEKSRTTIVQYMYDMICSKTQHADKASKISRMILAQCHGHVDLIDEYVHMMSDIGSFRTKCDEAIFA